MWRLSALIKVSGRIARLSDHYVVDNINMYCSASFLSNFSSLMDPGSEK